MSGERGAWRGTDHRRDLPYNMGHATEQNSMFMYTEYSHGAVQYG